MTELVRATGSVLETLNDHNGSEGNSTLGSDAGYSTSLGAEDLGKMVRDRQRMMMELRTDNGTKLSENPELHLQASTVGRVDVVKMSFGAYYDALNAGVNPGPEVEYPGVQDVFNPLQIMRDRRIRKKAGESLRKGSIAWVKMPSQSFSKYSKQHLIWQINPYEYTGDLEWRKQHWNELRGPDGKLWFGRQSRKSKHSQHFASFDPDYLRERSSSPASYSRSGSGSGSLKKTSESSASLARQGQYGRHGRSSLWNVGNDSERMLSPPHRTVSPTRRRSDSPSVRISSMASTRSETETGSASMSAQLGTLNRLKSELAVASQKLDNSQFDIESAIDSKRTQFDSKLAQFESLQLLSQERCDELAKKLEDLDTSIDKLTSVCNSKAARMEESFGYCDRTNGEINTSVTLKIRDLSERCQNLVLTDIDTLTNVLYNCVERLIVLVLWFIWGAVEVWRLIKGVFKFILVILEWILF